MKNVSLIDQLNKRPGRAIRKCMSLSSRGKVFIATLLGCWALGQVSVANSSDRLYPWEYTPRYEIRHLSQDFLTKQSDMVPKGKESLRTYSHSLAMEATIYGIPAVLQYQEMYQQAVDKSNSRYVGFNKFVHSKDLATPEYEEFQAPNVDTLYSNAWLDLSRGPVMIKVPPVNLKYYTLQFLDMYSNSSNIGTRTYGNEGGNYLIVPPGWNEPVPDDVVVFRVATPKMWVLMRVFAEKGADLIEAREFQDEVEILAPPMPSQLDEFPEPNSKNPLAFFKILDYVLRTNGHPKEEDALVYRFNAIGIGKQDPFDERRIPNEVIEGIKSGYEHATKIISESSSELGIPTGTGWNRNSKGVYGFNYFNRAVINNVGLGANIVEENYSFSTFSDSSGKPLDGSLGTYVFRTSPPPVGAFWSLTLYDATNFRLYPNQINRYSVSGRTRDLDVRSDGTITIKIQHERPENTSNWLPAPEGRFFLALRTYLPAPELLDGSWLPKGVQYVSNVK